MRHVNTKPVLILMFCAVFAFSLIGCGSAKDGSTSGGGRGSTTEFPIPEASGELTFGGGGVSVDVSNTSDGYIMVKYSGSAAKIKVQITGTDGEVYTYTAKRGDWQTFPLTTGNGYYKVNVLENVSGDMYTLSASRNIEVSIDNEFSPFLFPNQYVWFTSGMKAMDLGIELSEKSGDDLGFIENTYEYVINHISYDYDKAKNIPLDYIPDIEETLVSGKGICFDYASLMASILRAQNVPTKLEVGYSGSAYHAWISVYTQETGWIKNIIEFDGLNWSLMDPTLASSNDESAVKDYVGDGSNYTVKYNY
ncbi:MAG: transglutaminase-like domain-containing protein [Eubacteriales bacterium]|nr:transglutaminase-like domain-containing protein [Eubacteriales bacterium]